MFFSAYKPAVPKAPDPNGDIRKSRGSRRERGPVVLKSSNARLPNPCMLMDDGATTNHCSHKGEGFPPNPPAKEVGDAIMIEGDLSHV